MSTSSPLIKVSSGSQLICPKHQNSNIILICSAQNCKQSRKICQVCRQKQSLHISHHSNYIFRIKQFFDFKQSKIVISKLKKGYQDLQTFITKHKQFYKEQIQKISTDIDSIIKKFIQTSNQYKKIYLENFEKEINVFDSDFIEIGKNLKIYQTQKNHQESFFTKLFANDKNINDIEDIMQKNYKGFEVRANIMTLKSKITNSKVSKIQYKSSESDQLKFNELMEYLDSFCVTFYDQFHGLLANDQENVNTSPQKNNLKQSIVTETKNLSLSKVSSQTFQPNQMPYLKKTTVSERPERQLTPCNLPNLHPKVVEIKKYLKPFPNFTQTNCKEEGPFRYEIGAYLGNYENGLRSGKGLFVFDNGSYYEGSWQNDNMSGYGRLVKNNSYYEGDIRNGLAHGKGNYEDFEKTYSGEWKNDMRHGIGEEEFKDRKRKYVGSFANNKYEGRGKIIQDDFIYEGDFKGGYFEGEGLIKYKNNEIFKGSFKDNQRVYGRHTFPDGSYYEGTFRQNMPHGNGQFYWPDGIKYSGQWKNGQQDGIGIETLMNGQQMKGYWQNGIWSKWM